MIKKNYTIINDAATYSEAILHIRACNYLTYDVEATGLNVRKDIVIGFGFCGIVGTAYYLPIKYWDILKQELLDVPHKLNVTPMLKELASRELIMHNASYDIRITKNNLGIDLTSALIADTALLRHTVDEEGPFALKKTAIELQDKIGLDVEKDANEEQLELKANVVKNGGTAVGYMNHLYKADMPIIGKYCCADVDLTLRIANHYNVILDKEGLCPFYFEDEVMPLYKEVTLPMEEHGVKMDMEYIKENYVKLTAMMVDIKKDVEDSLIGVPEFHNWLCDAADKKYPVRTKGSFAQAVVGYYRIEKWFPISKTSGKFTLTKKLIEGLPEMPAKSFLLGDKDALNITDALEIQRFVWKMKEGHLINISSKHQLKSLVFDYMGHKPLSFTAKKSPQFDDDLVQHLADSGIEWASTLRKYNKLTKIKTAYYDRFLSGEEDGYYHFSYKQHGTISGRYGSDAQQLPRPMEDGQDDKDIVYFSNTVRRFFISGKGRKFIDCDYESLEPHVFAHVSNDEGLKNIFRNGHDFYSTIAIRAENLEGMSADKKAGNYLGLLDKQLRQKAKAYSLGVPYGMTDFALGKTLDVHIKEAKDIISGYLGGFPNLKKWMEDSKSFAQKNGYIKSEAGRIRHLPKAKSLFKIHGDKLLDYRYRKKIENKYGKDEVKSMYMDYKNSINNSRNFQIQSLSASIVNRSAILINREFKDRGIDGWVAAQVHDQLIMNVPDDKADECKVFIQSIMESYKLSLQLKAPPEIGVNWADAH